MSVTENPEMGPRLKLRAYRKEIEQLRTERKALENEKVRLEQQARRYETLIESCEDAVFIMEDYSFIECNKKTLEMYGCSHRNEILGHFPWDYSPKKQPDGTPSKKLAIKYMDKAGSGQAVRFPWMHMRRDKQVFNAEVSLTVLNTGSKKQLLAIVRDISELIQFGEKLKERESLFKALFEYAPDPYYITDLKGTFIDGNRKAEELTGYNKMEIIGKNFASAGLLSADQIPTAAALLARAVAGKSAGPEELILHRKGGGTVTISISTQPVMLGRKKIIIGIARDITGQIAARERLIHSEEKFRILADQSPNMIFINLKGKIVYANQRCQDVMGYSKAEFLDPSFDFRTLIAPEFLDRINDEFALHMRGKEIPPYEYRLITKRGKRLEALITTKLIPFEGEEAILGIITNITKLKQAEQRITASLREKELLLKEIHHRVKNNFQIIVSLLNLQIPQIEDPEAMEIVKTSIQRIRSMSLVHEKLYQTRDFARIDFRDYVRTVVNELHRVYDFRKNVRVILKVERISLGIDTAIPMGLIVNELITNAFKHAFDSDESGVVTINFKKRGKNKSVLIVEDTGRGLSGDIDIANTQSLGLRLISLLVEQLEGTLSVSGEKGTTFTMEFDIS